MTSYNFICCHTPPPVNLHFDKMRIKLYTAHDNPVRQHGQDEAKIPRGTRKSLFRSKRFSCLFLRKI